jgi:hypothetical protein
MHRLINRLAHGLAATLAGPRAKGWIMAGMIAVGGGLLATTPAKANKIPYNNSAVATSWCTSYPWYPYSPDCASIVGPPYRPYKAFMVIVDWGFGPSDPVSARMNFDFDFNYDPTLLAFNPSLTSLVCNLRDASVAPYCPDLAPGQGTMPLGLIADTFDVDQTGLTITETEDASGLPTVSISYAATAPITISERNFLALAFDLLRPMPTGSTVTYSTTLQADASFSTAAFHCFDENTVNLDCDSDHPSMSLRLHAAPTPTPAPMAAGGLPVLLQLSRRLRRRIHGR